MDGSTLTCLCGGTLWSASRFSSSSSSSSSCIMWASVNEHKHTHCELSSYHQTARNTRDALLPTWWTVTFCICPSLCFSWSSCLTFFIVSVTFLFSLNNIIVHFLIIALFPNDSNDSTVAVRRAPARWGMYICTTVCLNIYCMPRMIIVVGAVLFWVIYTYLAVEDTAYHVCGRTGSVCTYVDKSSRTLTATAESFPFLLCKNAISITRFLLDGACVVLLPASENN